MVDQKSKAGMWVIIELVGMNRPYSEQRDELFKIKAECIEKTGVPADHFGHSFGTTNIIQFYWPPEGDAASIERGLEAFRNAHPQFKVEFNKYEFMWM